MSKTILVTLNKSPNVIDYASVQITDELVEYLSSEDLTYTLSPSFEYIKPALGAPKKTLMGITITPNAREAYVKAKLGDIIKKVRKSRKISRKDFSSTLGVKKGYLKDVENNETVISLEFAQNILDHLKIDYDIQKILIKEPPWISIYGQEFFDYEIFHFQLTPENPEDYYDNN